MRKNLQIIRALPGGSALYFCAEKQKPRKNPRQTAEKVLTNEVGCDKMVLHSVIICPYAAILNCKNIVSQIMAVVKRKVEKILFLTTDPGVS